MNREAIPRNPAGLRDAESPASPLPIANNREGYRRPAPRSTHLYAKKDKRPTDAPEYLGNLSDLTQRGKFLAWVWSLRNAEHPMHHVVHWAAHGPERSYAYNSPCRLGMLATS